MTKKSISITVGFIIIIGVGLLVYFTKKPIVISPENVTNQDLIVNNTATTTPVEKDEIKVEVKVTAPTPTQNGITLNQIAEHSSRSSRWSAINGDVYDLTSWIPNHPGGEKKILSLCCIDGSIGYNGQHGGDSKTARILSGFKIGILAK